MENIADIRVYPVKVPLIRAFKAAYGVRDTADFVIIEIEDSLGHVGLGEASTIPIYDEGSQAGVVYVLQNYIKPLLIGKDPRNINYLNRMISKAIKGERYLKCAIDFALHDLVGKIYHLPVCQLFGAQPSPVKVCWIISAKDAAEIQEEALNKMKEGYSVFKLKVGTHGETDLLNIKILRETIGNMELRLDANEAWEPKEALAILERYYPYAPDHIEQPVPSWNIEGLKFIREHSSIPVVADESVLTSKDTANVVKHGASDRINIKISRCGGYEEAFRMLAVAEASGYQPFLGSMLELGIGTVGSAHFAAAFPNPAMATELVGPLLLSEDILKTPLHYDKGYLYLPEGPGFAIELNHEAVSEYGVK